MKCPEAARLIHDYLDKDIDEYSYQQLFSHLKVCNECNNHYQELKRTEQLLMILPAIKTTPAFADIVIQSIPKKKRENIFKKWSKRHPLLVAASIFLFLFSVSILSYEISDKDLKIVSGDYDNLVINGNEVILPAGESIVGDLIIENGNLKIQGEVKGNVTVVNGEILMADASNVDGHTQQIDQFFEWIWYQIKNLW